MLISSEISSFVGGVSQQPASQRLSSQMNSQVNGFSTISQGLQKRPPTEHIAKVLPQKIQNAFLHAINRDANERYLAFIYDGGIKVFGLDGTEYPVKIQDDASYLTADNPRTAFKAISVADYTFIVNKERVVKMTDAKTPHRPYEAFVYVKSGAYQKTYSIYLNNNLVASFRTPKGDHSWHAGVIAPDNIAWELYKGLVAGANNPPDPYPDTDEDPIDHTAPATPSETAPTTADGFSFSISGSSIYIRNNREDFQIDCTDGQNKNAMVAVKGEVNKVSDLPNRGFNGFTCKVIGEAGSEDDDFYVQYSTSKSSGVWQESVAPDIDKAIDASTMPHQLVRQADGTFVFQRATWKERTVGDLESSPNPSFVGRTITNMFFFRNRLGFLADDSIIMSENGEFFNFFRTSVRTLLDNDAIDTSVSHTKVALLSWAIPFNKELVIFSEQTQFVMQDADVLTAKTIALKQTTDFPASTIASPISVGKNLYFCVDKGDYSAIREYYVDVNTGEDANDITAHVPSYLPNKVYTLASSPTEDIFVVLSDTTPNSLYPYSYYWNGQQKLQSSWSRWDWEKTDTILYIAFINSTLYLAISREEGVFLESMDLSLTPKGRDELYKTFLDRKITTTVSSSDRLQKKSYISVPYEYDSGQYSVVVCGDAPEAGKYIKAQWDDGGFYVNEYLAEGTQVIFGRDYTFSVELSTIYPTRQTQSGTKAYTEGRLTLTRLTVNYDQSGFFKVKVKPEGRDVKVKTFSGKTLGSTAVLGDLRVSSGIFRVPIMTKNLNTSIVIENDSPLPSTITSAVWEGEYTNRSQQM